MLRERCESSAMVHISIPSVLSRMGVSRLRYEAPIRLTTERGSPCGQYISNKRPSRFVILSASEESLRGERFFASAQNDSLGTASADWQYVLFEMYWPLRASECEGIQKGLGERDMYVYFLHRMALILHLY